MRYKRNNSMNQLLFNIMIIFFLCVSSIAPAVVSQPIEQSYTLSKGTIISNECIDDEYKVYSYPITNDSTQSFTENVTLKINGGFGLEFYATNHGTKTICVYFNLIRECLLTNGRYDYAENAISNNFLILPGHTLGVKFHTILSFHPIHKITAKLWTDTISVERVGIVLSSDIYVFFTGPDSHIPRSTAQRPIHFEEGSSVISFLNGTIKNLRITKDNITFDVDGKVSRYEFCWMGYFYGAVYNATISLPREMFRFIGILTPHKICGFCINRFPVLHIRTFRNY